MEIITLPAEDNEVETFMANSSQEYSQCGSDYTIITFAHPITGSLMVPVEECLRKEAKAYAKQHGYLSIHINCTSLSKETIEILKGNTVTIKASQVKCWLAFEEEAEFSAEAKAKLEQFCPQLLAHYIYCAAQQGSGELIVEK